MLFRMMARPTLLGFLGLMTWGCQCGPPSNQSTTQASMQKQDRPLPVYLSILEPHAGGCVWIKKEVSSHASVKLATLSVDCNRGELTWDRGRQQVVLSFGEPDMGLAIWHLKLNDPELNPRRLPIPEPGSVNVVAIDDAGILGFGLVRQMPQFEGPDRRPMLQIQEDLEPGLEEGPGLHAVAQILRPKETRWDVIDAKPSRCCAAGAKGLEVLAEASILQHTVNTAHSLSRPPTGAQITDPQFLADLNPLLYQDGRAPLAANGRWLRIHQDSWQASLAMYVADRPHPRGLGLARMLIKGKVIDLPDWPFTPHDLISVQTRGPYLLVTDAFTGARPVVYNMQTGAKAYATAVGHAAIFWPEPIKAGSN